MNNDNPPEADSANTETLYQEIVTPETQVDASVGTPTKSSKLVIFLRFLVIGGGLFVVLIIGFGISFSACFTIKGPAPPECAPVSFITLLVMPAASLLFLIPLAKKIK